MSRSAPAISTAVDVSFRFLAALAVLAATCSAALGQVAPVAFEAHVALQAILDDQDSDGELDCGEEAEFRGGPRVIYPTTDRNAILPLSGLIRLPSSTAPSPTNRFNFDENSPFVLAQAGPIMESPTLYGCDTFGQCDGADFGYRIEAGNNNCQVITHLGQPALECVALLVFRATRAFGCSEPRMAAELRSDTGFPETSYDTLGGFPGCWPCPGTGAFDLSVSKSDGGISAAPGQVVPYTLALSNTGPDFSPAFTVDETVPAHTTFNSAASSAGWSCAAGAPAGTACSLAVGGLASGTSVNRIFAVTVVAPVPQGTTQTVNTATLVPAATPNLEIDSTNNTATDTTPILEPADLALVKSTSATTAEPGALLAYTLTLTNSGGPAAGVSLTETVPDHTTFVAASSSAGWSCADGSPTGTPCSLALGTVAGGATVVRTFAVLVANPLPANPSPITNTACAISVCATVTTPPGGAPALAIAKSTTTTTAEPGALVTYLLQVSNTGNRGASGVVVTETVPGYSTFAAAASSPGWSCVNGAPAGSTCTLALGDVAGGATVSRQFAVMVLPTLPANATELDNVACLPRGVCAEVVTPLGGAPDLSIVKHPPIVPADPGAVLVYALDASNLGNRDAENAVFTETVPVHTTFVAASSSAGWSCADGAPAGSACQITLGPLSVGGSASRQFAVRVDNPLPPGVAAIVNTACVEQRPGSLSSHQRPRSPSAGCDTVSTPPGGAPALAIDKVGPTVPPLPGSVVSYQLTVSNSGNVIAASATIVETVPLHTTFVAAGSSPGWSCADGSPAGTPCSLVLSNVAPGAPISRTFAVRIDDPLPPRVTEIANTACVDTDCDGTTVPPGGAAVLGIVKSVSPGQATPGGLLTFTLTVRNTGNRGATGVVLSEVVPDATVFVAAGSSAGWSCADGSPAATPCTLTLGDLPAGSSSAATFVVLVADPIPSGVTAIHNVACVPGGCDTVDVPPVGQPAVRVELSDSLPVDHDQDGLADTGDEVLYTLTVTNHGTVPLSGLTLAATPDAPSTLIPSATTTTSGLITVGTLPGEVEVAVTVPALAPGGTVIVTFQATVIDATMQPELSVQALVTSTEIPSQLSDDPDTIEADDPTRTPLDTDVIVDPPSVLEIPTLDEVGLAALALLLMAAALVALRRQGTSR